MQFEVTPHHEGDGFQIEVAAHGQSRSYFIPTATQQDFTLFFRELARDFRTRMPAHTRGPRSGRPRLSHGGRC